MNEADVLDAAQAYQTAANELQVATAYASEMMDRYQDAVRVADEKLVSRNEAEESLRAALAGEK